MNQESRKLRNLHRNNWPKHQKMREDFCIYLSPEIVIDILSRLPIRSIISCKVVCKLWRELVESLEFAKSHLCKSVPHLFVFLGEGRSMPYKMFEFVDEHHSADRYKTVSKLSFPHPGVILGSANGLLFLCKGSKWSRDIFVCNPITREYMKLPPPPPPPPRQFEFNYLTTGVGVSKVAGKYKLVRVSQVMTNFQHARARCVFQVHTLGTRSWRSFSAGTQFEYRSETVGAFLNGNIHCLAFDCKRISCFDLETELLSSFSSPPGIKGLLDKTLSVVGDRLCFCDSSGECSTDIWFMNEYGDEKSWTKEIFIREDFPPRDLSGMLLPIKVFINGDILFAREHTSEIFCYSNTTKAHRKRDPLTSHFARGAVSYTPTFLPLRTLLMVTENVCSF